MLVHDGPCACDAFWRRCGLCTVWTDASALRETGAVSALLGVETECTGTAEVRLDVPKIEETVDSAANRTVLALQLALLRRTRAVRERLDELVRREAASETRTPLIARWPRRRAFLEDLAVQLKRSIQSPPWPDVTRAEVSAAGLTAVTADPVYSRAWSRGWRALRPGMEQGEFTERLWISPSWEIYERWCFVKIGRMLVDSLSEWRWRRNSRVWVGERGGRRLQLELQPTFRAGREGADKRWSVSKERVPDLLLTAQCPDGHPFLLLDAKYRSSRESVLDAMTSAHVYRDSLRIGEQRPDAALLLLPAGGGAAWLQNSEFQRAHYVGANVLTPGTSARLPVLVADFLNRYACD